MHTIHMALESLPSICLQLYFVQSDEDTSKYDQYRGLIYGSMVLSLLNIALRSVKLVRASMAAFFRYQSNESSLMVSMFVLLLSDFCLRPISVIFAFVKHSDIGGFGYANLI
eukprot:UN29754